MSTFTLDGYKYEVKATVEATVTHHAPCVPECTECYPCKRCGLLHALNSHNESER